MNYKLILIKICPILVVTAFGNSLERERKKLLDIWADKFLIKPKVREDILKLLK